MSMRKIRKGDDVMVLTGKDKGKRGTVRKVLENESLQTALSSRVRVSSDVTLHGLDKLSLALLKDFERNSGEPPDVSGVRIAFVGFKQDEGNRFSGVFLSSLKKFWSPPRYAFFTRDQLDRILGEHSLQMSGMMDEASLVELGKLKAVDYLVTGHVASKARGNLLEAQIIRLQDGEIVCSRTEAFISGDMFH